MADIEISKPIRAHIHEELAIMSFYSAMLFIFSDFSIHCDALLEGNGSIFRLGSMKASTTSSVIFAFLCEKGIGYVKSSRFGE